MFTLKRVLLGSMMAVLGTVGAPTAAQAQPPVSLQCHVEGAAKANPAVQVLGGDGIE